MSFSLEIRKAVLKKTRSVCACCGIGLNNDKLTVDHYIPKAFGGPNDLINLYPLCSDCNLKKSDKIYAPEDDIYIYLPRKYTKDLKSMYDIYIGKRINKMENINELKDVVKYNNSKIENTINNLVNSNNVTEDNVREIKLILDGHIDYVSSSFNKLFNTIGLEDKNTENLKIKNKDNTNNLDKSIIKLNKSIKKNELDLENKLNKLDKMDDINKELKRLNKLVNELVNKKVVEVEYSGTGKIRM